MTIGERIKYLRERQGMTQAELGAVAGVSDKAVSTWEKGANVPRMGPIQKMAEYFNVSMAFIIGEEEEHQALPSNLRPMDQLHRQRVQLIGKVAAGQPIMAETDYETFVDAPVDCDAALEVQGDSMTPTYLPGDIVYIKYRPDVENGQVAVVLLDDSATLKHVYHDPDGLTLISDNPAYAPIRAHSDEYTYIAIYGVPVGYTRIYRKDPLRMIHKGLK